MEMQGMTDSFIEFSELKREPKPLAAGGGGQVGPYTLQSISTAGQ